MKAPMAFREPGIPAPTVPASHRRLPSPFVSLRVHSWSPLTAPPLRIVADNCAKKISPLPRGGFQPLAFSLPPFPQPASLLDHHFVAPSLHQIAVDCTRLHQIAPAPKSGGGLLPGSRSTSPSCLRRGLSRPIAAFVILRDHRTPGRSSRRPVQIQRVLGFIPVAI